jgi:hypothetical protein
MLSIDTSGPREYCSGYSARGVNASRNRRHNKLAAILGGDSTEPARSAQVGQPLGPVLTKYDSAESWSGSRHRSSNPYTLRCDLEAMSCRCVDSADQPSLGFWFFLPMLRGKSEAWGSAHPLHLPLTCLDYEKSFRVRR